MSAPVALALITANFFLCVPCFFYVSKIGQDVATETVTGVAQGVPIPLKFRYINLYEKWVSCAMGAVACGAFLAVISLTIAGYVADSEVKAVAYFTAFFGGIGAVSWVTFGASQFLHHRRILQQTTRD